MFIKFADELINADHARRIWRESDPPCENVCITMEDHTLHRLSYDSAEDADKAFLKIGQGLCWGSGICEV